VVKFWISTDETAHRDTTAGALPLKFRFLTPLRCIHMKAAAFDYIRPSSLEEVCRVLAAAGDEEFCIIAGGQTLVPLMAMRLARPARLIDINAITALQGIRDLGDAVEIGACTRQAAVERSDLISEKLPLLAKALPFIGHAQTRNRGTVGGSIVHGDPSAEIPLVTLTLDAVLVAHDLTGEKTLPVDGFFEGPMMTGLAPQQCLTAVRFPVWSGDGRIGAGFHEAAPRAGDFAIAAAAAQLAIAPDGTCLRAAVGVGGCASTPLRLPAVETALTADRIDDDRIADALRDIEDVFDPESTVHAPAEYRRRLGRRLLERAIRDATAEASR
jgi:CO/xanthine dehydrogenase FAD-binding subunit